MIWSYTVFSFSAQKIDQILVRGLCRDSIKIELKFSNLFVLSFVFKTTHEKWRLKNVLQKYSYLEGKLYTVENRKICCDELAWRFYEIYFRGLLLSKSLEDFFFWNSWRHLQIELTSYVVRILFYLLEQKKLFSGTNSSSRIFSYTVCKRNFSNIWLFSRSFPYFPVFLLYNIMYDKLFHSFCLSVYCII